MATNHSGESNTVRTVLMVLMLAVPTMIPVRAVASTQFWQELAAVVFLLVISALTFRRLTFSKLSLPGWPVFLITSLLAMAVVQSSWVPYFSWPPIVALLGYGLVFLVAMLLGRALAVLSPQLMAKQLSMGLLLAALLQSLVGVVQLIHPSGTAWVLQRLYLQAYGNIGQPNHYADFLICGAIAAWYLCYLGAMRRATAWSLIGWFAISITFAASRGSLVALVFLTASCGFLSFKSAGEMRKMCLSLAEVFAALFAVQLLVPATGVVDLLGVVSATARVDDAGANGQRAYIYQVIFAAVKGHPWGGIGVGGIPGWAVDTFQATPPQFFSKFVEHSHNLLLEWAATMGVPFAAIWTLVFVGGIYSEVIGRISGERLLALSVLAVICVRSMFEYPLWYTYFLIVAGLCCSLLVRSEVGGLCVRVPTWGAKALLALLAIGTLWTVNDFARYESAYADLLRNSASLSPAVRARVAGRAGAISEWSLLSVRARTLEILIWDGAPSSVGGVLEKCEGTVRSLALLGLTKQCMAAAAVAGDIETTQRYADILCQGYPGAANSLAAWAVRAEHAYRTKIDISGFECRNN